MRKFRLPLILLSVIAVLSFIAYWDESKIVSDKKVAEEKGKFLAFKPEDIQSFRFERQGKEPILLTRDQKNWMIQSPIVYSADALGIERLIKNLADVQSEKEFKIDKAQLKDYGLDVPQTRLVFEDKANKVWNVQIGAKSPVGYSSYVRLDDGDTVYLVSHYVFTATNKELIDFRDKSLKLPGAGELSALNYQWLNEPEVQLVFKGDQWLMERPKSLAADKVEVEKFLNDLSQQFVSDFIDKPNTLLKKALTKFDKGSVRIMRISFTKKSGEKQELVVVENDGSLYANLPIPDTYGVLDGNAKDILKKDSNSFLDKTMFRFNSVEAKQVTVDQVTYVRDGSSWKPENSKKGPGSALVRSLLIDLEFAKAEKIITAEEMPHFKQATHRVSILMKDNKRLDLAFFVDPKTPDIVYVKSGDSTFISNSALLLNVAKPLPREENQHASGEGHGEADAVKR